MLHSGRPQQKTALGVSAVLGFRVSVLQGAGRLAQDAHFAGLLALFTVGDGELDAVALV
jgi:hypothetical protein